MSKSSCLCVLCRNKSTIKSLFPTGHFKVAHKQGASPHAQDISLDQLSATFEPIPYLSYLTKEPEDEVEEKEEDEPVPKAPAKFPTRPVPLPVAWFGSHVEKKHANNNQPFMTEFDISQL